MNSSKILKYANIYSKLAAGYSSDLKGDGNTYFSGIRSAGNKIIEKYKNIVFSKVNEEEDRSAGYLSVGGTEGVLISANRVNNQWVSNTVFVVKRTGDFAPGGSLAKVTDQILLNMNKELNTAATIVLNKIPEESSGTKIVNYPVTTGALTAEY